MKVEVFFRMNGTTAKETFEGKDIQAFVRHETFCIDVDGKNEISINMLDFNYYKVISRDEL